MILKVGLMCSQTQKQNNLRLLAFNVEGLTSKLEDPSFIKLVQQFGISVLTETWKRDTSKLDLGVSGIFPKREKEEERSTRTFDCL